MNWRHIARLSIEDIIEHVDVPSLQVHACSRAGACRSLSCCSRQALVEPLAFAKLSLRDLSAVPEEWMLKLLRLFQLCMEYMLNVKVRIKAARGKRRPIPTSCHDRATAGPGAAGNDSRRAGGAQLQVPCTSSAVSRRGRAPTTSLTTLFAQQGRRGAQVQAAAAARGAEARAGRCRRGRRILVAQQEPR